VAIYKQRQKAIEEAKDLARQNIYTTNSSRCRPRTHDTIEDSIDPFFDFEDDRMFQDINEEQRYLDEKLLAMFKPEYDSEGRRKKNQKPDNTVKDYWLSKAKDYPILL